MSKQINLGSFVRDISTGFSGIAVSRLEYINGCVQYCVQPKCGKDGKRPDSVWLDWQYLEVSGEGISKKIADMNTGGPSASAPKTYGH